MASKAVRAAREIVGDVSGSWLLALYMTPLRFTLHRHQSK
jgi:hypothetical protein